MQDYKYDRLPPPPPHHLLIYSKKAHSSMVDIQTIFQDIDQEHCSLQIYPDRTFLKPGTI